VGIFAVLGLMHLTYTLLDFVLAPRHFRPIDDSIFNGMKKTKTALAPEGRSYWLNPLLITAGALYAFVSYCCWFKAPTMLILLGTVSFAISVLYG
jgi:hypothetical protein